MVSMGVLFICQNETKHIKFDLYSVGSYLRVEIFVLLFVGNTSLVFFSITFFSKNVCLVGF